MGENATPLEALPPRPHLPPSEEKHCQNQPFLAKFLFFCHLRNAFCPLDAPPPPTKKSGVATLYTWLMFSAIWRQNIVKYNDTCSWYCSIT